MNKITGYEQDNIGSWIRKDPQAKLVYSMDWSEWLAEGQQITGVDYTLQVRSNDPEPLVRESQGITGETISSITYVELSGGAVGKIYTVTAEITTDDGSTDRRSFRIKVENRSA